MLTAFLLVAVFLSFVIQEFIPPVSWLSGARIFLMPIVVFYGALALPYPLVLALSFTAGLLWDLTITSWADSAVDISLGWSILSLAILSTIIHGFRPMFLNGRWEIHCLASGIGTALFVFSEYVMISFHRQDFYFDSTVWWRIGGAGIMALFLSPLFYLIFHIPFYRTLSSMRSRELSPFKP